MIYLRKKSLSYTNMLKGTHLYKNTVLNLLNANQACCAWYVRHCSIAIAVTLLQWCALQVAVLVVWSVPPANCQSSWNDGSRNNQHPTFNHDSEGVSLIEIVVDFGAFVCYWCVQIGIRTGLQLMNFVVFMCFSAIVENVQKPKNHSLQSYWGLR